MVIGMLWSTEQLVRRVTKAQVFQQMYQMLMV